MNDEVMQTVQYICCNEKNFNNDAAQIAKHIQDIVRTLFIAASQFTLMFSVYTSFLPVSKAGCDNENDIFPSSPGGTLDETELS